MAFAAATTIKTIYYLLSFHLYIFHTSFKQKVALTCARKHSHIVIENTTRIVNYGIKRKINISTFG
jgi:hypothetical protein